MHGVRGELRRRGLSTISGKTHWCLHCTLADTILHVAMQRIRQFTVSVALHQGSI
jgi:hypothetical protein